MNSWGTHANSYESFRPAAHPYQPSDADPRPSFGPPSPVISQPFLPFVTQHDALCFQPLNHEPAYDNHHPGADGGRRPAAAPLWPSWGVEAPVDRSLAPPPLPAPDAWPPPRPSEYHGSGAPSAASPVAPPGTYYLPADYLGYADGSAMPSSSRSFSSSPVWAPPAPGVSNARPVTSTALAAPVRWAPPPAESTLLTISTDGTLLGHGPSLMTSFPASPFPNESPRSHPSPGGYAPQAASPPRPPPPPADFGPAGKRPTLDTPPRPSGLHSPTRLPPPPPPPAPRPPAPAPATRPPAPPPQRRLQSPVTPPPRPPDAHLSPQHRLPPETMQLDYDSEGEMPAPPPPSTIPPHPSTRPTTRSPSPALPTPDCRLLRSQSSVTSKPKGRAAEAPPPAKQPAKPRSNSARSRTPRHADPSPTHAQPASSRAFAAPSVRRALSVPSPAAGLKFHPELKVLSRFSATGMQAFSLPASVSSSGAASTPPLLLPLPPPPPSSPPVQAPPSGPGPARPPVPAPPLPSPSAPPLPGPLPPVPPPALGSSPCAPARPPAIPRSAPCSISCPPAPPPAQASPPRPAGAPAVQSPSKRKPETEPWECVPDEGLCRMVDLARFLEAMPPRKTPACRPVRPPFSRPPYQSLSKHRYANLCPSAPGGPSPPPPPPPPPAPHAPPPHLPPPLYTPLPLSPFGGKVVEQFGSPWYCCSVASMNGQRPSMEDAHGLWLSPTIGVFGVFDGHAGRGCAHFIGKEFPALVAEKMPHLSAPVLEQLCLELDEHFIVTQNDDSGCTAAFCAALPRPDGSFTLHVGNIGDARVLVGRKGALVHATDDHKPTLPEEAKRVHQCGGWVDFASGRVDGLLAVSRAFGDRRFKNSGPLPLQQKVIAQPALSSVHCLPDDFVVVACDGIFERDFTSEEVVTFVWEALNHAQDAGVACAALCEEALRRGSGDNMTAMIVQFRAGSGRSHVPLPPPYILGDPALMYPFHAFAEEAGLTVAQALQARHDLLLREQHEPQVRSYPPEVVEGMRAELAFFGPAPSPEVPRDIREGWFQRLAAFYAAVCADPYQREVSDPRHETPSWEVPPPPLPPPQRPRKLHAHRPGHQTCSAPARGFAVHHAAPGPTTPPPTSPPLADPGLSPLATAILLLPNFPLEHPESRLYIPRMVASAALRGVYDACA